MNIADLTRRAESGSCVAQTTLGLVYLYGDAPVDIDYGKALRFLSMAAEQGASRAIANLGDMYLNGLGTARNVSKAIQLYEQVGKLEFFAALELGRIYASGMGVPVDARKALEWYSVALSFAKEDFDCDALAEELSEAKDYVERRIGEPT